MEEEERSHIEKKKWYCVLSDVHFPDIIIEADGSEIDAKEQAISQLAKLGGFRYQRLNLIEMKVCSERREGTAMLTENDRKKIERMIAIDEARGKFRKDNFIGLPIVAITSREFESNEEYKRLRDELEQKGIVVTNVRDRVYVTYTVGIFDTTQKKWIEERP